MSKIVDFAKEASYVNLVPAGSYAAGTQTPAGVDIRDYQGIVAVVVDAKTGGTGTLDVKIQDSADNTTFADLSPAVSIATISTVASVQAVAVDTRLARRYIRAYAVIGTGPQLFAVYAAGQKQII